MNIHASPAIAKPIQLFKVGNIVRIKNSETVGRVIEDTNNDGSTMVHIFDDTDGEWGPGGNVGFIGCLTLLAGGPSLDLETVSENLGKISVALEMVEDLGKQEGESGGNGRLGHQLELIGSTFSSMSFDLLDMLYAEQSRQEAESKSDE